LPGQLIVDILDLVEEAVGAVVFSVTRLVHSALTPAEVTTRPRLTVVGPPPPTPVSPTVRPAARRA
jgi:hypothetical protein